MFFSHTFPPTNNPGQLYNRPQSNSPKNFASYTIERSEVERFVIFLNFPCLIACLLCFLLMSFFFFLFFFSFACFVVRGFCRELLSYPPLPPSLYLLCLPTIFSLIQNKWQLFEISTHPKLVSVPFSSLLLDIGPLQKSFLESIV